MAFNDGPSVREYKSNFGLGVLSMEGYADSASRRVADLVLETFDIPFLGSAGGFLEGIDLKHMDAISALKMSLLEEFSIGSSSYLLEPIVNADGYVEFVAIGKKAADFASKIYYEIPSKSFVNKDTHVMITGRTPIPTRNLSSWKNILSTTNGYKLWDTQLMYSNCNINNFRQHSTITFHDPHFNNWAWDDGISSIYDVLDPFEKVLGWVYYLDPGDNVHEDTNVYYQNNALVPVLVSQSTTEGKHNANIGELIRRKAHPGLTIDPNTNKQLIPESCFQGLGSSVTFDNTTGVVIPIDDQIRRYDSVRGTRIDKFVAVQKVYLIGYFIDTIEAFPISDAAAKDPGNIFIPNKCEVWIDISNPTPQVYELNEGEHYVIGFVQKGGIGAGQEIRVLFANNASIFDYADYGNNVPYKIYSNSNYFKYK